MDKINGTKNGKQVQVFLANNGGRQYKVCIRYADGQTVHARYQPKAGTGIPSTKYWAEQNGIEVMA